MNLAMLGIGCAIAGFIISQLWGVFKGGREIGMKDAELDNLRERVKELEADAKEKAREYEYFRRRIAQKLGITNGEH